MGGEVSGTVPVVRQQEMAQARTQRAKTPVEAFRDETPVEAFRDETPVEAFRDRIGWAPWDEAPTPEGPVGSGPVPLETLRDASTLFTVQPFGG